MSIEQAAFRWYTARSAFLALPAGDPKARELLNELAEAESALAAAVRALTASSSPSALDMPVSSPPEPDQRS